MSEKLKLLPCPACGGDAEFMAADGRIFVSCPECGMRGPSLSVTCRNFKKIDDQIDADAACINAWNALPRRADIERVERERDWLAENMPNDICPAGRAECAYRCPTAGGKACYECLLCWLEAARQATTER